MMQFIDVVGSQEHIPAVEIGPTTVYIRTNIRQYTDPETGVVSGWVYDEIQLSKDEYMGKLSHEDDTASLAMLVTLLMSEMDALRGEVEALKS